MRIFKRFGLYVLGIVLVVALVSAALLVPWLAEPVDFHDQKLRARLAGEIDTLIIGQSYAMNGVMAKKLDERLGTHTYNLSGSLMPIYGQTYMVKKELARNPVRHVLIEITPDTFTNDQKKNYGNGDSYIIARLDSFSERLHYLVSCVPVSDWPNIYARLLMQSLRAAADRLLGKADRIDDAKRGFSPLKAKNVRLDPDYARKWHRSMSIFHAPIEENIREYEALIELCQRSGCEVTLFYTPVAHGKVWQLFDQDTFLAWARELAAKYDVPLFDFNLLKDRYTLLSDEASFSDENHLSGEGAEAFSAAMADVLQGYRAGKDVSGRFYPGYEEVLHDSFYWGRQEQEERDTEKISSYK